MKVAVNYSAVAERDDNYLMPTYQPLAVQFSRGKGCWLSSADGDEYLDAIAGVAVTNLGHSPHALNQVLARQAEQLWHVSNVVEVPQQALLGQRLCALAGMDKAFFCNSGAEANETALKLARLHGSRRGITDPKVVVMSGAFHGRTLAMLSATDNPDVRRGFGPLVQGFVELEFNNCDALARLADDPDIVAVLLEPIQGESGVRIADADFMQALQQVARDKNWLLMLDEIQAGLGRCGQWFGFQLYGLQPDVITLAKALGNGFPIGACLAAGKAADLFTPGSHGSTFGGNPLGCRLALAVLDQLEQQQLAQRAAWLGEFIVSRLTLALQGLEAVREIRGQGLLIGIEFNRPLDGLAQLALQQEKLLINVTRKKVVRLLPALTMTEREACLLIERLVRTVSTYLHRETMDEII